MKDTQSKSDDIAAKIKELTAQKDALLGQQKEKEKAAQEAEANFNKA